MKMMNKYQTVFTEEDFKLLPKEVKAEFYEFLETVPFIKWLIQPEESRGFAKNLSRWDKPNDLKNRKESSKGRIHVDITKPHILEDMDFFRERAIFFDKYGKYTDITPNPNPKSDYAKFWKKEVKKWREGMYRESDGEWIPGGLYFYWNYCPIWLVEESKNSDVEGTRQRKFPKPWLGDYLFFHYMEQARNNGEHVKMLKTRGVGASFKMGSLSPRNMYVFPGSGNPNFHLASDKTFLTGDKGVFGKVIDTLDWIADNTPLPKLRLINSLKSMEIQLGYQDEYGVRKGPLSSVYGISLKDNPDKARGIRGPLIHYEEDGLFPHLESAWNINRKAVEDGKVAFGQMVALGCVCAGTKVWTNTGELINIEDLYSRQSSGILGYDGNGIYKEKIEWFKEPAKKPCYRIKTSGNNIIECSEDHPLLMTKNHWRAENSAKIQKITNNRYCGKYTTFTLAKDLKIGDQLLLIDEVPLFGNREVKDARLLGLMIGDGNCTINNTPQLSCGDEEIFEFIKNNYNYSISKQFVKKTGGIYRSISIREIIPILKIEGLYGKVKYKKTLPKNIHEYDKHSLSELLGGYYDADGNVTYNKKRECIRVTLTSISESLLTEVKYQLIKFGIHSTIQKEFRKDGYSPNTYIYRLYITNHTDILRFQKNIKFLCTHKQNTLDKILTIKNKRDSSRFSKGIFKLNKDNNKGYFFIGNDNMQSLYQESIKEIEFIGDKFVYNMHTKTTNTYLSNMYITKQTGGVEGGDFAGAEKLFYNPTVYRIYGIPNVYDKNSTGKTLCGFFWGAYLNRKGCYDINSGEPDVTKALMEIVINRVKTRASATDSKTITQNMAEEPITPQEAVMRIEGTVFPVADLKDYLGEISSNMLKFTSPHYVGNLIINSQGEVEFRNDSTIYPVRDFPALDNKKGAVEIYEFPKKSKDSFRYIIGVDPYDDDIVEYSDSLGSVFVFDRYTRRIVAEYTGRPGSANEFYEIVYRLARFYNATIMYENNKKGLFAYFNNVKGAITMLADTPEILTDKQLSKPKSIAGNVSKGINATAAINSYGLRLQADWMLEPAYSEEIIEQDEEESINKILMPNFRKIRSVGYIKEAVAWHPKLNADRVSAMNMVMIYDTELSQYETFGTKSNASSSIDPFYSKIYPIGKDSGTLIRKGNKLVFGYTPK